MTYTSFARPVLLSYPLASSSICILCKHYKDVLLDDFICMRLIPHKSRITSGIRAIHFYAMPSGDVQYVQGGTAGATSLEWAWCTQEDDKVWAEEAIWAVDGWDESHRACKLLLSPCGLGLVLVKNYTPTTPFFPTQRLWCMVLLQYGIRCYNEVGAKNLHYLDVVQISKV